MPHVTLSDKPILSTLPRALIQDTLDVRVYEGDREQVRYERSDHTPRGVKTGEVVDDVRS